jgi:hypothetical protein
MSDIHHIPISLIKFWWPFYPAIAVSVSTGLRRPRYATPAPSCRCVEGPPVEVAGYLRKCVLRTNWYCGSLNVPMGHITQPLDIWSFSWLLFQVMSFIFPKWDSYQPLDTVDDCEILHQLIGDWSLYLQAFNMFQSSKVVQDFFHP